MAASGSGKYHVYVPTFGKTEARYHGSSKCYGSRRCALSRLHKRWAGKATEGPRLFTARRQLHVRSISLLRASKRPFTGYWR